MPSRTEKLNPFASRQATIGPSGYSTALPAHSISIPTCHTSKTEAQGMTNVATSTSAARSLRRELESCQLPLAHLFPLAYSCRRTGPAHTSLSRSSTSHAHRASHFREYVRILNHQQQKMRSKGLTDAEETCLKITKIFYPISDSTHPLLFSCTYYIQTANLPSRRF